MMFENTFSSAPIVQSHDPKQAQMFRKLSLLSEKANFLESVKLAVYYALI